MDVQSNSPPANSGLFLLEAGMVLMNEQEAYVISLIEMGIRASFQFVIMETVHIGRKSDCIPKGGPIRV